VVAVFTAEGVPDMAQVDVFKLSPVGSTPPEVIEQVVVAPFMTTVEVIERADPTVPVLVLGEILMVGAPAPILKENVATGVFVPTLFVAVTE